MTGMISGLSMAMTQQRHDGAAAATDPDFASVTALYGFNQANFGSGVDNDGSLGAGSVFNSGVAPDTDTVLVGSASGEYNQTGLESNNGIDVGTTDDAIGVNSTVDYTIECWVFVPTGQTFNSTIFCNGDTSSTLRQILSIFSPIDGSKPGVVQLVLGSSTTIETGNNQYPVNAWFHFAWTYTTNSMSVYVDGTRVISTAVNPNRVGNMLLGRHNLLAFPISGPAFMDELRITKGIRRYSGSSHVVPAFPFPRA